MMMSVLLLTVVSSSFTALAWAQTLDPETTREAEQLGERGIAAYEAGQYESARQHLEKGYALSGWGTIGVWLAKTYRQLDMEPDAYRVYADVAAASPQPNEAAPFGAARQEAEQGAAELAAELSVVQFKGGGPAAELRVSVDAQPALLTRAGQLALAPGEHVLQVDSPAGRLASLTLAAEPGTTRTVELESTPATAEETTTPSSEEAPVQQVSLTASNMEGWTLTDAKGNVVCTLPCRWEGTEVQSLSLRREDTVLPIRLGRRLAREPAVDVHVRPERGSKGWALGLGITSGVLALGSLQAASEAGYGERGAFLAGAAVFGAGFAACTWWYLWSKSRPYLDYDRGKPASETAMSLELHWVGSGFTLGGAF